MFEEEFEALSLKWSVLMSSQRQETKYTFFEEGNEFSLVFTKSEVTLEYLGTSKYGCQHERERGDRVPDVAVTKNIFCKTAFTGQDWHCYIFLQYSNSSQQYFKENK